MKRTLLQAFIFSILVCVLYYGIQIGVGMYKTLTYVPEIQNQYENVEHLQQRVTIGAAGNSIDGLMFFSGIILISMVSFIAGKRLFQKFRGNR